METKPGHASLNRDQLQDVPRIKITTLTSWEQIDEESHRGCHGKFIHALFRQIHKPIVITFDVISVRYFENNGAFQPLEHDQPFGHRLRGNEMFYLRIWFMRSSGLSRTWMRKFFVSLSSWGQKFSAFFPPTVRAMSLRCFRKRSLNGDTAVALDHPILYNNTHQNNHIEN